MQLDDATIQIYKDGDYGSYLDLESTLSEQLDEIEGLRNSRRNSLVIRTQLSVRVHSIIGKKHKLKKTTNREKIIVNQSFFSICRQINANRRT